MTTNEQATVVDLSKLSNEALIKEMTRRAEAEAAAAQAAGSTTEEPAKSFAENWAEVSEKTSILWNKLPANVRRELNPIGRNLKATGTNLIIGTAVAGRAATGILKLASSIAAGTLKTVDNLVTTK